MLPIVLSLFSLVLVQVWGYSPIANNNIALHWGQDADQYELSHYSNHSINMLLIDYFNVTDSELYVSDANLTQLGIDIKTIQDNEKLVLLSVLQSPSGFESVLDAKRAAHEVWNKFGNSEALDRPFNRTIVDGFVIGFDNSSVEFNSQVFVRELKQLMGDDKELYLSGVVPSRFIANGSLTADMDFLFIHYNDTKDLRNSTIFTSWDQAVRNSNRLTKLYLDVTANASNSWIGNVTEAALQYQPFCSFGGVAFENSSDPVLMNVSYPVGAALNSSNITACYYVRDGKTFGYPEEDHTPSDNKYPKGSDGTARKEGPISTRTILITDNSQYFTTAVCVYPASSSHTGSGLLNGGSDGYGNDNGLSDGYGNGRDTSEPSTDNGKVYISDNNYRSSSGSQRASTASVSLPASAVTYSTIAVPVASNTGVAPLTSSTLATISSSEESLPGPSNGFSSVTKVSSATLSTNSVSPTKSESSLSSIAISTSEAASAGPSSGSVKTSTEDRKTVTTKYWNSTSIHTTVEPKSSDAAPWTNSGSLETTTTTVSTADIPSATPSLSTGYTGDAESTGTQPTSSDTHMSFITFSITASSSVATSRGVSSTSKGPSTSSSSDTGYESSSPTPSSSVLTSMTSMLPSSSSSLASGTQLPSSLWTSFSSSFSSSAVSTGSASTLKSSSTATLSTSTTLSRTTSTLPLPTQTTAITCPVIGDICTETGAMYCLGDGYAECWHDRWKWRPCAPGTVCNQVMLDQGLGVCDWTGSDGSTNGDGYDCPHPGHENGANQ